MFCTNCGSHNANEAKFCANCGTKIAGQVEVNQPKTSNEYISPYESEEIIFSVKGKNPPKRRIFPKDKDHIPLLSNPACDLFLTTKRLCLTMGDPNIKEPSPTKWFIPIGGGVGAIANMLLQDAINGYTNSQFKKKHGQIYAPAEIDIMCLAGNAVYTKGPLKIEIYPEKIGFFKAIGNDPRHVSAAFIGDFQYQDRVIKGAILQLFSDSAKDLLKLFQKVEGSSVHISETNWNDDGDIKHITSRLS